MATEIVGAQTRWTGGRDEDGHRTYKLYVQTVGLPTDGPERHLSTPGLPVPGSVWVYDNDYDPYAYCTGAVDLTARQGQGQVNIFFDHVYTFTSKPRGQKHGKKHDDRGSRKKCADVTVQDPLLEPPKTSGAAVRNTEEYTYDRFGDRLCATSFEPFTGPQVEFDRSRRQVTVEYNDATLDLETVDPLVDTVNDATMWGLPARCWKLCEWHWERKLYGECYFYYTKRFVFESNVRKVPDDLTDGLIFVDKDTGNSTNYPAGTVLSAWDHYVPDVTSLALDGEWTKTRPYTWSLHVAATQYTDPRQYVAIPAPGPAKGNIRRCLSRNVRGTPAVDASDELVWRIQVYEETDFFSKLRQLPTTL